MRLQVRPVAFEAALCFNQIMMKGESKLASLPRQAALDAIWRILDSHADKPAAKLTNVLAHDIVKRGISSRAIAPLGDFLGLGKGEVAEYLDLDRGTANRRAAKDQPLPRHAAEGVLRFLELEQMAVDTFETEEEASGWLRRQHPMLEHETPLEAAKSSFGAQRVRDILLAVKYGGVV